MMMTKTATCGHIGFKAHRQGKLDLGFKAATCGHIDTRIVL